MSRSTKTSASELEQRRRDIDKYADSIFYSARYSGKHTTISPLAAHTKLSCDSPHCARPAHQRVDRCCVPAQLAGFDARLSGPARLTFTPPLIRTGLSPLARRQLTTRIVANPDDDFEYRHVILPKALVKYLPNDRLATEDEWRGLGIRQSPGWEHYLRHGEHTSFRASRVDGDGRRRAT